jgi:hypothetical protein
VLNARYQALNAPYTRPIGLFAARNGEKAEANWRQGGGDLRRNHPGSQEPNAATRLPEIAMISPPRFLAQPRHRPEYDRATIRFAADLA